MEPQAAAVPAGSATAGRRRPGYEPAHLLLYGLLLAVVGVLVVLPIASVLRGAVVDATGFTVAHVARFFYTPLYLESLRNSVYAGVGATALASLLALPPAFLLGRYRFRGQGLLVTWLTVPLVIPPFVGAIGLNQTLGRAGVLTLLLEDRLGVQFVAAEGLRGVILAHALHYFPFILLTVTAALANVDPSLEEAAQVAGARGLRLLWRVTLPLVAPAYAAGAILVFVRATDDLGTPLILNVKNMLGPQAYFRITTIAREDPDGYAISLVMLLLALGALGLATRLGQRREVATLQTGAQRAGQLLRGWGPWVLLAVSMLVGFAGLLPHLGVVLLSVSRVWSLTYLPTGYTLDHYEEILFRAPQFVLNTLLYSTTAAVLAVAVAVGIAYLQHRGRVPAPGLLDFAATAPIAVPGVVLGVGFLRVFDHWAVPGLGVPLTALWVVFPMLYVARRLPYAVRATSAAMAQVHPTLEEAAAVSGARRWRIFRRVVLPLVLTGAVAAGILVFVTAAVEFSGTVLLISRVEQSPLSYGIYLYAQSPRGRGAAAALGTVAVVLVALGTYVANRIGGRRPTLTW
ncbi:MAG: ABC transporter permease [candidate division GAL15 bacterium]